MIVIIDTGAANLGSVKYAIERLDYAPVISSDPSVITNASKIFLPGVGTACEVMANLKKRDLVDVIKQLTAPVLGICLGMQILAQNSFEGEKGAIETLGLVEGSIRKMEQGYKNKKGELRFPHMGWNQVSVIASSKLFKGIPDLSYFYFVHSYSLGLNANSIASCDHGDLFSAAIKKDNFYGVQFHPERSGKLGALLIKNFLEL